MVIVGGTKNSKWLQIVSNISGKCQYTVEETTDVAYGDVLLAALSIGFYEDSKEITGMIKINRAILPDENATKQYAFYKKNILSYIR